jgi:C4-type Zn-finger protein
MAEIQTKEFENVMAEYYIGNEIPKYFGHYFIPASFHCEGCSTRKENVYVRVWLEIKERKLIAVRTRDPETDELSRQVIR